MSALIPDVRALALTDAVDAQRDRILDVTRFVNGHPELAHEEFELVSPLAIRRGSGKALALEGGGWAGVDYALYAHPESLTGVWRSSRWMQLFAVTVPGDADPASWGLPADRYRVDELARAGQDTEVTLRVLGDDAEEIRQRAEDARAALSPRVAAAAEQSLSALGIPFEPHTPRMPFSTDFGNVSRRVPAAMIGFSRPGPEGWAVHVDEGEEQFLSDEGENLALTMSAALAVAADRLARFTAA